MAAKAMTKSQILSAIADETELTKKQVTEVVEALVELSGSDQFPELRRSGDDLAE